MLHLAFSAARAATLHARPLAARPHHAEPRLDELDADQRGFVRSGQILYRSFVVLADGDRQAVRRLRGELRDPVPHDAAATFRGVAGADEIP